MSLAKIDQTDETKLIFEVEVSGTKEDVSQHRLVIEADQYSIICKGVPTKDGIEVQLPKLKGLLDEGVYKATLEIIIGDRIFTPLTEVIEVNPNIELKVESKTPETTKTDSEITVKVGKTTVSSIVQEAKEEGYIVVDVKNRKILKKDGLYLGEIVNDEMIFSNDDGHEFVTDLFEALAN